VIHAPVHPMVRWHGLGIFLEVTLLGFSPPVPRAHSRSCTHFPAIMKKILTMLALSSLATVSTLATAADLVGNPKDAQVAMCIGCHGIPGYKASFPEVYQVPMLGGQSAKYIQNALKAYQKGERTHPTMRGIAGSLSDQDMANLAAYYSQQK
jgi:cytochrome c553